MSHVPTVVQAFQSQSGEVDLYLSKKHLQKLELTPRTLTVQFGSKTAVARVSATDRHGQTFIQPSLARTLLIPTGVPLRVRYLANQQRLVFGPYVGILVSQYNEQFPLRPFGTITPFMNEVADTCHSRGGIVCVFRLKDVDWNTQTLRGLVRRNGLWKLTTLPLPQCIYNRLISRRAERSEAVGAWIQRCKEASIPFFNEKFLDKWHVHMALESEPEAREHLPKTVRYHSHQDLKMMLTEFRTVYAKPTDGSMGKGIFRIRRRGDGFLVSRPGGTSRLFSSLSGLNQYIQQKTKGTAYLLQQGLTLIGMQQRPTDFRVLVQKNRRGEWGVTSLVARVGQNQVVSNISRGGTLLPAAQALRNCGPWIGDNRPNPRALCAVALKLARLLEQSLAGQYAEFGVDLGVDVYGRIWLLEVNSKPSKSANAVPVSETDEQQNSRARPSVIRLIDYTAYLSGFPRESNVKLTGRLAKKKKA